PTTAPEFENFGVALEQRFKSRTYLSFVGEIAKSDVNRALGVVEFQPPARATTAAACAALTAIAGLLCLGDPWRNWFERLSYDLPFLFAPEGSFTNVIVVELDQKSYVELRQKYVQRWDRSLYVRLLDKLTADGAKLVVLDIF